MDDLADRVIGIARKGDVCFIELGCILRAEDIGKAKKYFDSIYEKTGVYCVLLGDSAKLARVEKNA